MSDGCSDGCSSYLLDAARAGALEEVVAADRAAAIGDDAPCGGRAHRARALEAVDGDESMVLAVDDADHQAGETVEIEEAIVLGMNGTRDHDFDGFANGRDQRIRFEEAELEIGRASCRERVCQYV